MSVVLRLFATIALIFLLSSAGGALIGYHDARQRIATELDAAMAVGRATAERSTHALANSFRPGGHLTEFVSLFDGDRHLQARLYSADGVLIKQSSLLVPAGKVPAWFVDLLKPAEQIEAVRLPSTVASFARLTLQTDALNEIDEIWSSAVLAAMTLLLFMGLVLSLVALVVWHALRPVKPLLSAFDRLGTPDEQPALRPFGPPEFRQLHASFNAMAERLKATERRNAALGAQIATIQEEERAELARDLHDEVGPQLFAIDVDAAAIRAMLARKPAPPAEIAGRAAAISASAVTIKQHVRAILARLRPNLAADIGLEQALIDLIAAEQTRHPGVRFEQSLSGNCRDAVASAALYAVAREALHNALLHARPAYVRVSLTSNAGAGAELTIENDGSGLQPTRIGSHGLRNMRERVEALGGAFSIDEMAQPPGVRVRAILPHAQLPVAERAA